MSERTIVAVAISQNGMVCSMPRPNRHHHVMRAMAAAGIPIPITGEQGFLTSDGRFVDRTRALLIAKQSEQVKEHSHRHQLFSEDLW